MTTTTPGTEIATTPRAFRAFDDAQLRDVSTWDDFGALVKSSDTPLINIAAFGPGFVLLESKDALIDMPFVIVGYRFSDGDQGVFVSVEAVVKTPISINGEAASKIVFNDGSTGICATLQVIAKTTTEFAPIYCPRGLRKSEYVRKDEAGEPIINPKTGNPERATTFHLSY